jgi:hypothetical protein
MNMYLKMKDHFVKQVLLRVGTNGRGEDWWRG